MIATPETSEETMAIVLKRRLVGLLVLLLAVFMLSLVLRGKPAGPARDQSQELQTIVVPLGGSTAASSAAENSTRPQRK